MADPDARAGARSTTPAIHVGPRDGWPLHLLRRLAGTRRVAERGTRMSYSSCDAVGVPTPDGPVRGSQR